MFEASFADPTHYLLKTHPSKEVMPTTSYTKETTLKALTATDKVPDEDLKAIIHQMTVCKATLMNYHTEIKRLYTWVLTRRTIARKREENPNYAPTVDDVSECPAETLEHHFAFVGRETTRRDFDTFMVGHATVHALDFSRVRSALRMAQLMSFAPEVWAIDEDSKNTEKGCRQLAITSRIIAPRVPRGTLDKEMIKQLINFVEPTNPTMAAAMRVQVGACLRIGELIKLVPALITAEYISIVEAKTQRARAVVSLEARHLKKYIGKWRGGEKTLKFLNDLARDRANQPRLFPPSDFTIKQYNKAIQDAAVAYRWPTNVKFDGSHCLRHAGVRLAIRDLLLRGSIVEASKWLLMSPAMIARYALSNDERRNRIRVPHFLENKLPVDTQVDSAESDSGDDAGEEDTEAPTQPPAPRSRTTNHGARQRRRRSVTPPIGANQGNLTERETRYARREARRDAAAATQPM